MRPFHFPLAQLPVHIALSAVFGYDTYDGMAIMVEGRGLVLLPAIILLLLRAATV